jgi:LysR family transcriptional regulator, regulator for metE and metH
MAIECHSCFNWLMPVIDRYRPHWPQVELDFSGGFTFEPLPALARGEVDMVITTDPQPLKGLVYQALFDCEMRLAVAPRHRLAGSTHVLPEQLRGETLITYPVAPARLDVISRFLEPAGVLPKIRTTEMTLMMVQMVASGRGVCCLPNWVLDEYANQGQLTSLALGAGVWSRVQLALRAETQQTAFAQDFIRMAREHCFAKLKGVRPVAAD